jgi:hypothetical protein
MNPTAESGIAAADCTPYSGDVGIDRQQVSANARTLIAQQIEVKLKAVDKVYLKKVSEGKAVAITKTFESVSEQVSEQTLRGAKVSRMEKYKGAEGEQVCALVVVPSEQARQAFDRAVQLTGAEIRGADREDLYSMFSSDAPNGKSGS